MCSPFLFLVIGEKRGQYEYFLYLFSGELVDGETHSYFEILDSDGDNQVSRDEMRVGVMIMEDQCETLRDISAEKFSNKNCWDGEV